MDVDRQTARTRSARNLLLGVLVLALLAAAGMALRWMLRARATEVPLGVEHAVTLRYSGPDLVIKPFDRGVAVHLRIAGIQTSGHSLVYDIRYVIDRRGRYNILDYLTSASGEAPANLPAFVVQAVAREDETMEQRVQSIEPAGIHFWHRYRELLAVLAGIWLAWLAALIFWHRHHHRTRRPALPDYDAFHGMLRAFLDRLGTDGLDAAGKLALETLMLAWWRDHCAGRRGDMYAVVQTLAADPVIGGAYQTLECWLHDSETTIARADVIEALRPYTVPRAPAARDVAVADADPTADKGGR